MRSSPRNTSKGLDVNVSVILRRLVGGGERGQKENVTGRQSTITSSSYIMVGEAATRSGKK